MTAHPSRRSRNAAASRRDGRLSRNAAPLQLHITHVGGRTDEDAALTIYAPAPPILSFGGIAITLPPGGFLKATIEAEKVIQADIAGFAATAANAGSGQLVDFFAGCGTPGLPLLAGGMRILAAESDEAALKAGVNSAGRGAQLVTRQADMVIIDPPRNGAAEQIAALVDIPTAPPLVAMVSCNPASFARDAASLVSGGYAFTSLRMIDQFRFAPHIELVACFTHTGQAGPGA